MKLSGKEILLIEDDDHVCQVVEATLQKYNADLDVAKTGQEGLELIRSNAYDAIVLDIMLPDIEGTEICRVVRGDKNIITPIIMLTARVEEADRVLGFELGADDYITKPFSPRELVARINACIRCLKRTAQEQDEYCIGPLDIDERSREVLAPLGKLDFPRKEFDVLLLMAKHPGQVFGREHILNSVWGYSSITDARTVDEHIKRIRKKLKNGGVKEDLIKTVWGVGYKMEAEDS